MKVSHRIEIFNIPEYIRCKICGKPFKSITPNHLKKHGLTIDVYKVRYPGPLVGSSTRLKMSDTKKEWAKTAFGVKLNPPKDAWKKTFGTEALKKKKEMNILVGNLPSQKRRYSKQMKELWKDPAFQKKQEEMTRKRNKERWADPKYRRTHTGKKHCRYGKKLTKKTKDQISKSRDERYTKIRGLSKEDLITMVRELKDEGFTQSMIAEYFGYETVTQSLISHWCQKEGIIWEKPSIMVTLSLAPDIFKLSSNTFL